MSPWAVVLGIDRWLQRHTRPIGFAGAIWFAMVCASYAGFIQLPKLVAIPASVAMVFALVRYGVWDAFVTPKIIAARREETECD